jgi:hypothetical protein
VWGKSRDGFQDVNRARRKTLRGRGSEKREESS